MTNRGKKRALALVMTLALLAGRLPTAALDTGEGPPCDGHPEHTAECGYVAAVDGHTCKHELGRHDEACGYAEGTAETPCDMHCAARDENSAGLHAEGCAYAPAVAEAPCGHVNHDETCGYMERVEGASCAHIHDETCAGQAPDGGPIPCALTGGCPLPDGHADVCGASGSPDAAANFTIDPATILTVEFNDNGSGDNVGGASLENNQMKTAVEAALKDGDRTKITAIQLTGNVDKITGHNWKYLLDLYKGGNDWSSLTTMDLSGMSQLTEVKNEINSYNEIRQLTAVHLPDGLRTIGPYAFYKCGSLTSVTLPRDLQTIGKFAFSWCHSLTSVTFPKDLETIEEFAFKWSLSLTAFVVDPGNQYFESEGGVLYDKNKETLLQYPPAKSETSFTIPGTVKTIEVEAFFGCNGLTSVTFPASLQTIGESAFQGCNKLTSADLSYCTALQAIEDLTFDGCSGLTSVSFPASLQTIMGGAFSFCTDLTSLTFLGETPPTLNRNLFSDVPQNGTLHHPANTADAYASGTFAASALDNWTRIALYTLTVAGGTDETGRPLYPEGAQVMIKAGSPPTGQVFDKWTAASGTFADAASPATTFTMPAGNVTVSATYKKASDPDPAAYPLTLRAGTGGQIIRGASGSYTAGATISIEAGANEYYVFDGWISTNGGSFGDKNSPATTFAMPAGATTVTANFRYVGGSSSSGGGGSSAPSATEQAVSKVEKAKDGDTVKLDLPSNGKLPGKVLEAAAGRDITLEISAGSGVTWIVNGKDIPSGKLSDLNLKVNAKANTIPVNVINALTGEQKVMQLALSHNGEFPMPLTLRLDAGKENAGLFANLYYYNETAKELEYQTTAEIGPDGNAHIPFAHASSYAVIIDQTSHAPVTEPGWENPFTDVGKTDWFYEAVEYVHQQGLMVGTTDTAFRPSGAVTRAQVWTVLARMDGQEISGGDPWYDPARDWAVERGVSDGTNPDGAVTREQLVTMLYRYAQVEGMDVSVGESTNILSYTDALDVAEWAIPAFQWACGAGVVSGTTDSTLSPQAGADRAQLAAILMRFLENT